MYIKGLELEVNQLKESFANISRDKGGLAEENRQLKQLLATHGIAWSGNTEDFNVNDFSNISSHINSNGNGGPGSTGYTSSGSISGTYASGSAGYSPPPHSNGPRSLNQSPTSPHQFVGSNGVMNMNGNVNGNSRGLGQQRGMNSLPAEDFNQTGIDFVLTYDPSKAYMSPPPQH